MLPLLHKSLHRRQVTPLRQETWDKRIGVDLGKVDIKPNILRFLVQIALILTVLGFIKMCTFFGFGLTLLKSLHSQIGTTMPIMPVFIVPFLNLPQYLLFSLMVTLLVTYYSNSNIPSMPFFIHLLGLFVLSSCEPLGKQSGKQALVKTVTGFLQPSDFYTNHVIPGIPVFFKGAAKSFPAFKLWTDKYLGSFEESKSYLVDIEEGKKENRSLGSQQPSFKKFLEMYQKEDVYFVSGVPEFLRKDILIYESINCPYILDKLLIDLVMWFSSGGTTSVWHNDGYENINCLIKGTHAHFTVI